MHSRYLVRPLRNRIHGLQRWIGAGLDLLFPIQCAGCGKTGDIWCKECDASMVRLTEPLCRQCGHPLGSRGSCPSCASRPPLIQVRSYARYRGRVAQALLRLKYRPDRRLASMMGAWLEEIYVRQSWNVELVVPVPLSPQKMQVRGFNQAALLAEAFGNRAGLPVEAGLLKRVRDTRSQVGLDPDARWHNVSQAFRAESLLIEGANVLVLDDLFTTGATLSACAVSIRAAGAESVVGLTVARA